MGKFIDLTGQRFGFLTVKNRVEMKVGRQATWRCICDCGNESFVQSYALRKNFISACGCQKRLHDGHSPLWKGCGKISGSKWCQWKGGAALRSITFEITIKEAWDIFENQNGKCALSGEPLQFASATSKETTASLDRIDSALGYTSKNVQWLHKNVNRMKSVLNETEFIEWCNKIANFTKNNK